MTTLTFERHRAEILLQTTLLRDHVRGADLRAPVPSCPGWNLGQLLRHVGGAHGWAETVVRTRAVGPVSDEQVNDVARFVDEDPDVLDAWLAVGAARLAEALRGAGPRTRVWTPADGLESTDFWARRMAHETLVHRFDAALAAGVPYAAEAEVVADALDEWMEYAAFPEAYGAGPGRPALLGPGRTLCFWATDADASWLVDLTGDRPGWRHGHGRAAVTVRGPLTDLLLFVYGRAAPDGGGVDVTGDEELVHVWRERAGFWLEADDSD
ncbi:maleylpyruvate isomerase family mycothiol-dependent enzyme [Streptomyces mashuensis]|nr:maleylpyruvate isomerase family mycothiol-dependent enzyme [Streptomyces mashuensis]